MTQKGQEMRKIAVTITKGGVGKTTTAVNLAAGLAIAGKRVLLIDTDTQGQAAICLGVDPLHNLADVMMGGVPIEQATIEARPNLFLLAGGQNLAQLKTHITLKDMRREYALADALQGFDNNFDFVIIDSGPGYDILSINILVYAGEILAPVNTEVLSVQSLGQFIQNVKDVRSNGHDVKIKYIVPTFYDKRVKKTDEVVETLIAHFGDLVCDPIRYNVKLSEAPAFKQTIFEFDQYAPGAFDYVKLVKRIISNGTK